MGQTLTHAGKGNKLCVAVREGDVHSVAQLTAREPKLVNYAPEFCERLSPLHLAASHGQLEVLNLLLQRGGNPNVPNNVGQTPLMLACKSGRWLCVPPLLEQGANQVLCFDYTHGRTCLHYAAKGGHTECVRRILAAASTGPVAESWGYTRFVNVRDGQGATPLHLSARAGHVATVRLLLESGALVGSSTSTTGNGPGQGSLPLHFAARGGSVECVRELLAWGADRNQRDMNGHTAYMVASKVGHVAAAALLDPSSAEPLVWPSPWKFMSKLDAEARSLLEAALVASNAARMRQQSKKEAEKRKVERKNSGKKAGARVSEEDLHEKDDEASLDLDDEAKLVEEEEMNGKGEREVCSICFERFCTIQVKDCGHQMCATCTLSLCCHCKPNPTAPNAPPPACPFCRRDIGRLVAIKFNKPRLESVTSGKWSGTGEPLTPGSQSTPRRAGDIDWMCRH